MEESQAYYEELSLINEKDETYKKETYDADPPKKDSIPSKDTTVPLFPKNAYTFDTNPASIFYDINPDYVGWLKVNNTKVDYPVVRGADNEVYLDKNFNREPDVLGSIFMDYRNIGMGLDRHTIIYGHFTERGLMFGDLNRLLKEDFLKENDTFSFSTPQGEKTYIIFSIHVSPAEGPYIQTFFNDSSYGEFLEMLNSVSIFDLGVETADEPNIISLITCDYALDDGRLFIHAVEIDQ